MKWDLFVAVSCDGFQTFENSSYDCWPIAGLNLNLPPEHRFLSRNVVPLGLVKGPRQPKRIDKILYPFIDEVNSINSSGGTKLSFYDGATLKVRAHVMYFTGDIQAVANISGTVGPTGKSPCRFCVFHGFCKGRSNYYYFPSKLRQVLDGRRRIIRYSNMETPTFRDPRRVDITFMQLSDEANLSVREREALIVDRRITGRTTIFDLKTITPFISFPIDMMHETLNLVRDFMKT